jgi:putative PIG3 family NAD(P)H quinone oxidoreductase
MQRRHAAAESDSTDMRAIVITEPGEPEVLSFREVPDPPQPGGDQVLIRVRAAGVNRADILQRRGQYPAPPGAPRDIPGLEFAGEVEAVGSAVQRWKKGARVMGITGGGGQAEYVIALEGALAEAPDSLNWIEAAALPEVFITAHDALFTQAGLQVGETVLIHAAASGVGTAAVQLAHAAGCLTFGTSRRADKLEKVRALGLDEAIVVPEGNPGAFADAILEATAGFGVHAVLDLVGAPYLAANLKALATLGRLICVGTTAGTEAQIDLGSVLRKRLRIYGTMLRSRTPAEKAAAVRRFSENVLPLVRCGMLKGVIDSTFSADQVVEAHRRVEANETFGKVILTF